MLWHTLMYLATQIMKIFSFIFISSFIIFLFFNFTICSLCLRTLDICPQFTLGIGTFQWKFPQTFWWHILAISYILACVLNLAKRQARQFPTMGATVNQLKSRENWMLTHFFNASTSCQYSRSYWQKTKNWVKNYLFPWKIWKCSSFPQLYQSWIAVKHSFESILWFIVTIEPSLEKHKNWDTRREQPKNKSNCSVRKHIFHGWLPSQNLIPKVVTNCSLKFEKTFIGISNIALRLKTSL